MDTTQAGAGLNTDGTYTANGTANYIATSTSLVDATEDLDAQVKTNAADIATNAATGVTNATNISTNATNIASNDTDIAANATAITANAATGLTNATAIVDLQGTVTTAISDADAAIAVVQSDVNQNELASDTADVTHTTAIAANAADIATNTATLNLKEDKVNKSINVVTDGASDIKYPSVKSVKTYVDNANTTNANLTGPITSVGNVTSVASQTGTGTTFAMNASPTFTGTTNASNLSLSGTLGVASTLGVSGSTTLGSTLSVAGVTTLSSTLNVAGVTTLTGVLDVNNTTDISGTLTLSKASGTGLAVTKDATIGGTLGVTGVTTLSAQPILSTLTASLPVFSDGSKGLVSNTITGSGSVVMSASPTLTGTPTLPTGTIATTQTVGDDSTAIATTAFVTAASGPFSTTSNVTANTNSTIATDDFVFGSTSLNNIGGADDDRRFFFDKSKGAFRAGFADGTQWDAANIGAYSTAIGYRTTASGGTSAAMGYGTDASGDYSTAMGDGSIASGETSTAMGYGTDASGDYSTAMGYGTDASGDYSTAMGDNTTADAYAETVVGRHNTAAASPSATTYVLTDRLFTIGNGTGSAAKSDALIVLKNGNTTLKGALTFTDGTSSFTLPNTDGNSGEVLATDGSGAVAWAAAAVSITEVADEFSATVSQTAFTLAQTPSANSKVKMYVNGIRISNTAYTVSGTTLTYIPANNGAYALSVSDRIQFDYFY